jgi:hypothetical protein
MKDTEFDAIAVVTLIESNWAEFVSYCGGNEVLAESTLRRMRDEAGMS